MISNNELEPGNRAGDMIGVKRDLTCLTAGAFVNKNNMDVKQTKDIFGGEKDNRQVDKCELLNHPLTCFRTRRHAHIVIPDSTSINLSLLWRLLRCFIILTCSLGI